MSQVIVPIVVAVIGSGGLIGGIAAFLKLRPEKDSIVVSAAQGALLVQTGIVDQLRQELQRAQARAATAERVNERLERRIADLESELAGWGR